MYVCIFDTYALLWLFAGIKMKTKICVLMEPTSLTIIKLFQR